MGGNPYARISPRQTINEIETEDAKLLRYYRRELARFDGCDKRTLYENRDLIWRLKREIDRLIGSQ